MSVYILDEVRLCGLSHGVVYSHSARDLMHLLHGCLEQFAAKGVMEL